MPDLTAALAANRAAVDDMIGVVERTRHPWNEPRAPGKWSPAQVVEHVAMALEENGKVAAGKPSKIPTLPFFIRPVVRIFFNRIVRTGNFPKAKTNAAMTPDHGPTSASDARARLLGALAKLEHECRALETSGRSVNSGAFGVVSVEDFVRFNELHVRHHTKQIPIAL
ncbi:MAG: DinB family protein [Gemmatimonadetes bacterium]|nr:DinB family protein [Gemmatimonadota bacterium]